jgi:hypothetical protein
VQRERSVLGAINALVLTAKEKGRIADTNDPEDVKGRSESDFHAESRRGWSQGASDWTTDVRIISTTHGRQGGPKSFAGDFPRRVVRSTSADTS